MRSTPLNPALYQINTAVWLGELGTRLGRPATLEDVPDAALDEIATNGFDWVWLLGIWQTGDAGRQVSLQAPELLKEYHEFLPDYTAADVRGSPFAITAYQVHREFGGPRALVRFRERMAERNLRLMLDFVPNHTALDHPWVSTHPEFYIHGSEEDLAREPMNYIRRDTMQGLSIFAHGRDPYFPGWADTLQLNYRYRGLRETQISILESIAGQCDGVRCDMAMLVLPDIIQRTWQDRSLPVGGSTPMDESFWAEAIPRVHRARPDFLFMAEAYWDLEWTLQQQGFDYTYDKKLYDRLESRDAASVRAHLRADPEYQRRSARFLENHDEPRAEATFPEPVGPAAATIALLLRGLRFVHEGQSVGRRVRASNHLRRRLAEPPDPSVEEFYDRLFACMRRAELRDGNWSLMEPRAAWPGNLTSNSFVAFAWELQGHCVLVAVNYGGTQAQCYVPVPQGLDVGRWLLRDLLHPGTDYVREGTDLRKRGLYLDLPAWGHHVFEVMPYP